MKELFDSSNVPDAPTPISSAGNPTQAYRNAAGEFNLNKELRRKVKSRRDLDQPKDGKEPMRDGTAAEYIEGPLNTGGSETDDATQRYFGSFSVEAKRLRFLSVVSLTKNIYFLFRATYSPGKRISQCYLALFRV